MKQQISLIVDGVRGEYFQAAVGLGGVPVKQWAAKRNDNRRWPYSVGHNGRLESFATYDGARRFVQERALEEVDRLHAEALALETAADLERMVDEITH